MQVQNYSEVYFENPFVTALLKRDGKVGIQDNGTFMTEIVKKYVMHDMDMVTSIIITFIFFD